MNADQPNSIVEAIFWSLFLFPAAILSVAFGVISLRVEWEKQKERVDLPFYAWLKTLGSTILVFCNFCFSWSLSYVGFFLPLFATPQSLN
jgi:hypothetical protein